MSRHYVQCVKCRKIGVTAELLGHCQNAGLRTAPITKEQARQRDLNALRKQYGRTLTTDRAGFWKRFVGWLRSWIPE